VSGAYLRGGGSCPGARPMRGAKFGLGGAKLCFARGRGPPVPNYDRYASAGCISQIRTT